MSKYSPAIETAWHDFCRVLHDECGIFPYTAFKVGNYTMASIIATALEGKPQETQRHADAAREMAEVFHIVAGGV